MAELHEEAVWHVPYTAEQIQESIGKNPVYSDIDENGDRYWMLWDIATSQYVKTDVKVFIGDIEQISAEAEKAEAAAKTAEESASAAVDAAQKAEDKLNEFKTGGGAGGSSFYGSDFYLFLCGKHPVLNSGPFTDYGYYERLSIPSVFDS